jgi:hypothetical protein
MYIANLNVQQFKKLNSNSLLQPYQTLNFKTQKQTSKWNQNLKGLLIKH